MAHLTELRTLGLQARSDEALRLVTAGTVPAHSENRLEVQTMLARQLLLRDNRRLLGSIFQGDDGNDYWNELLDHRRALSANHRRISQALATDLDLAIVEVTGGEDDHLIAVGDRFDADLAAGIEGATDALLDHTDRVATQLVWLQIATTVLAVGAAAGVVVGVRARLEEYR